MSNRPHRLRGCARVSAAALLELGAAVGAANVIAQAAFATEALANTPPTNGCSLPNTSHAYGSFSANYGSTQAARSGYDLDKGVQGINDLFNLAGYHQASHKPSKNFVDQEEWLLTDASGTTWEETGVEDGTIGFIGKDYYTFFYAQANSTSGFKAALYDGMTKIPSQSASYHTALSRGGISSMGGREFNFTLVENPYKASHKTWSNGFGHDTSGPYYTIRAGSESTCISTTYHDNQWWDSCTGSGDGCDDGVGPNYMAVGEKIYDASSGTWKWEANWQPGVLPPGGSCPSGETTIGVGSGLGFCKTDMSTMLALHLPDGDDIASVWAGQYTG
jgi:hypothetical protein